MFIVKPLVRNPSPALKKYLVLKALYEEQVYEGGWLKIAFCRLMQLPVQACMWVALRPRSGEVGDLKPEEVDSVYLREAGTYYWKHHFTTRGQDTWWRRRAGFLISLASRRLEGAVVKVLDICTGVGLTVSEATRVISMSEGIRAEITGIDYNEAMLAGANGNPLACPEIGKFRFARADATNMTGRVKPGFVSFEPNTFDVATQVFGIGGVSEPAAVFREVLSVLKEGGFFFLHDMHTPIKDLPGEWFIGRFWRMPLLEVISYKFTTEPLLLKRLWAWRGDTSLDYPRARLAVIKEGAQCFGFEELWFNVETERWWLGIPIMTTARIILRKVKISREEYKKRAALGIELEERARQSNP